MCVWGGGGGGWYSKFCLLYSLGFKILNFTIFGELGKKMAFLWVLAICRYFLGVTFKTDLCVCGCVYVCVCVCVRGGGGGWRWCISKFSVFLGVS